MNTPHIDQWLGANWVLTIIKRRYGGDIAAVMSYDEYDIGDFVSALGGGDSDGVHAGLYLECSIVPVGFGKDLQEAMSNLEKRLGILDTDPTVKKDLWLTAYTAWCSDLRSFLEWGHPRPFDEHLQAKIAKYLLVV